MKHNHYEGVWGVHTNCDNNIIPQDQKVSTRNSFKSKIGDKSPHSTKELVLTIESLVCTKKKSLHTFSQELELLLDQSNPVFQFVMKKVKYDSVDLSTLQNLITKLKTNLTDNSIIEQVIDSSEPRPLPKNVEQGSFEYPYDKSSTKLLTTLEKNDLVKDSDFEQYNIVQDLASENNDLVQDSHTEKNDLIQDSASEKHDFGEDSVLESQSRKIILQPNYGCDNNLDFQFKVKASRKHLFSKPKQFCETVNHVAKPDHDYSRPPKVTRPLQCEVTRLTKVNNLLRSKNLRVNRKLRLTRDMVKNMKIKLNSKNSKLHEKNLIKTYLANNGFSTSEIFRIMNPKVKNRKVYTEVDLCHGLILHSQCRRSYEYLLEQKLCSLPNPRTLLRWKSKLKFKAGIQQPVLQLLKQKKSAL